MSDDEWLRLLDRHEKTKGKERVEKRTREKRKMQLDAMMAGISMYVSLMPSPALMALNPNLSKEFVTEQMDKHNDRLNGFMDKLKGDL